MHASLLFFSVLLIAYQAVLSTDARACAACLILAGYHKLCGSHELLREVFQCESPPPVPPGVNEVRYALDWHYGVPLGVWGGPCTCRARP